MPGPRYGVARTGQHGGEAGADQRQGAEHLLRGDERLTIAQVAVMRGHAAIGGLLVARDERIAHLAPLVRAHHERIDRYVPSLIASRSTPTMRGS